MPKDALTGEERGMKKARISPTPQRRTVQKNKAWAAVPILTASVAMGLPAQAQVAADALPTGGVVAAGSAAISSSGAQMQINQSSDRAAINWNSFNIGSGAKVQVNQPGSSSVLLNTILGGNASQIFGSLSANGQVFLVNPAGVYFAPGARADVGGIVASTMKVDLAEFMAGRNVFTRGTSTGSVVNEGTLQAAIDGYVALLAPEVRNQGVIIAPAGTVVLAAGDRITLQLSGSKMLDVGVDPATADTLVSSGQVIQAPDGTVVMTAKAANALFNSAINVQGVIAANSLVDHGGVIRLEGARDITVNASLDVSGQGDGGSIKIAAADGGTTSLSGTFSATGATGKGGSITAAGKTDLRATGLTADASGAIGGGSILLGGDAHGAAIDGLANATSVSVDETTRLIADATGNGDGGKVVIWADDTATYAGQAFARGGAEGGDGGFVETSGHQVLNVRSTARVNTLATKGIAGQWLLDPNDIEITTASVSTIPGASRIDPSVLITALASGNVSVTTTGGTYGGTGGVGDILIVSAISYSSSYTLTFTADNDVSVYAGVSNAGTGQIVLSASHDILINSGGSISAAGAANGVITLSALHNFTNSSGSSTAVSAPNGRWVIYSASPWGDTFGGLTSGDYAEWNGTMSTKSVADLEEEDAFGDGATGKYVFSVQPTITISLSDDSKTYGDAASLGSGDYTLSGAVTNTYGNVYLADTTDVLSGSVSVGSSGSTTTATVGSYDITATTGGVTMARGYGVTVSNTATLEVEKRTLTLSGASAGNKTYDGGTSASVSGGSLSNLVNDDSVSFTLGSASFSSKNVGLRSVSYSASLSGDDASNYALATPSSLSASIGTLTISVTGISASNKTYDGNTTATLSGGSLSGVIGDDSVSFTLGSAAFGDKNVGTGKSVSLSSVTLSGGDASNYAVSAVSGLSANITVRSITLVGLSAADKTYDGSTSASLSSGSLSNTVGSDDITYSLSGNATFEDKNAGYNKSVSLAVSSVSISGDDAGNYTLVSVASISSADIYKRNVTLSGYSANDKTYDGGTSASLSGTASLANTVGDDEVSYSLSSASFSSKNVGLRSISLSGSLSGDDASNYTLVSSPSLSASISTLTISVTGISASNKTYDGNTTATLSGGSLSGVIGDDSVSFTLGSAAFGDKNVGTGKSVSLSSVTLSGGDASNYAVSAVSGLSANITVRSITLVGLSAADKTYDGSTSASLSSGSLSNTVGSDDITYSLSGNATFEDKNAGYNKSVSLAVSSVSISGDDAGNYTLVSVASISSADIYKRNVTLSGYSANDKTYDGGTSASLSGTASLANTVGDDEVSYSLSSASFSSKNVGLRSISLSGSLSGDDASNYTLVSSPSLSASISTLTISLTGVSANNKTYDGNTTATLSGGSLAGKIADDDVSFTLGAASFDTKNVGTDKEVNVASVSLAGEDAANYAVSGVNELSADITKKTLQIAVQNASRNPGVANPTFSVDYSGLVGGDGSSVVTGLTLATAATSDSAPGVYPITASGGEAENYEITYLSGTLTIRATEDAATVINREVTNNTTTTNVTQSLPEPVDTGAYGLTSRLSVQETSTTPPTTGGSTTTGSSTTTGGTTTGGSTATTTTTDGTTTSGSGESTASSGAQAGGSQSGDTGGSTTGTTTQTPVVTATVATTGQGPLVAKVTDSNNFAVQLPKETVGNVTATDVASAKATLSGGGGLPSWLTFNPESQTFVATNAPAGSLPVTVQVQIGGNTITLEISQ